MAADLVAIQRLRREVPSAGDLSQAIRRAAQAVKRPRHLPFGGGIEEAQLVSGCDVPRGTDLHALRVHHNGRSTRVVEVRELAKVLNVPVRSDLNGEIGGLTCHPMVVKSPYHLTGGESALRHQAGALASALFNA